MISVFNQEFLYGYLKKYCRVSFEVSFRQSIKNSREILQKKFSKSLAIVFAGNCEAYLKTKLKKKTKYWRKLCVRIIRNNCCRMCWCKTWNEVSTYRWRFYLRNYWKMGLENCRCTLLMKCWKNSLNIFWENLIRNSWSIRLNYLLGEFLMDFLK